MTVGNSGLASNVRKSMRALVGLLSVLAVSILFVAPVAASCAPPTPVADNAARALAVVQGTVTSVGSGSLTLRVDRVLKGSVATTLVVFLGPGRGGAGGTAVATSVDYTATVGTDHVLYLIRGDDGQLETNACIGSHAGPPNAEETAYFGAGTSPVGPDQGPAPAIGPAFLEPVWLAVLILLIASALTLVVGTRILASRGGLRQRPDRG